jgi:hypothetical protein
LQVRYSGLKRHLDYYLHTYNYEHSQVPGRGVRVRAHARR